MRLFSAILVLMAACTFGRDPAAGDPYGSGMGYYGPYDAYLTQATAEIEVINFNRFSDIQFQAEGWVDNWGDGQHYLNTGDARFLVMLSYEAESLPSTDSMQTTRTTQALTIAESASSNEDTTVSGSLYFCPNDGSGSADLPAEVWREPSDDENIERLAFRAGSGSREVQGRFSIRR